MTPPPEPKEPTVGERLAVLETLLTGFLTTQQSQATRLAQLERMLYVALGIALASGVTGVASLLGGG